MWWLIIVIGIVLGVKIADSFNENIGFSIVWGTIYIIFILFVVAYLDKEVIKEYEVEQYKIQGLENNITTSQNTKGSFILGFGYVNSETQEEIKYYYFKVNDIGKKLETIEIGNNSDTYIRETDEMKPCLIYRYQKVKTKAYWKWLFGELEKEIQIAEILVVPSNTIKIEYNVEV